MTITLVPPLVQPAVGHGVLHRAIVLVRMGAVGKAAEAHVGPQVAEKTAHLLGTHVPKLELAHAGRIDHVSAAGQAAAAGRWSSCACPSRCRRSPAPRGDETRDRWRSAARTCPRRSVRPRRWRGRPTRDGTARRRNRSSRSAAAPRSPSGRRPPPAAAGRPGRPGRSC